MSATDLSPALVNFIREHVGAIELLEVLLLLHRERRAWTSDAVAAELRIHPRSVDARFASLAKSGLLIEGSSMFRFNGDSSAVPIVEELAAAYQSHRVRVVETVFSRPADNIRIFADAFVIGKGGKTDG